jgi:hypothetical protein
VQRTILTLTLFLVVILSSCSSEKTEVESDTVETGSIIDKEESTFAEIYGEESTYIENNTSIVIEKVDDSNDFILPNSDSEYITIEDLDKIEKEKLDYVRNEIYARHGYNFKSKKYQDYFESKDWYKVDVKFSEDDFSDVEKTNLKLINEYVDSLNNLMTEVSSNYGKYDLDNNGMKEKITLVFKDNSTKFTLNIDNVTFDEEGNNFKNTMFIYDINIDDEYTEIAIIDEKSKDSYITNFYRYNGDEVLKLGSVIGGDEDIKITGNCKIVTRENSKILAGWEYSVIYYLKDLKIEKYEPENLYLINSKATLKEDLTLQYSTEDEENTFTILKDEEITLLESDDIEWISIKNSTGDTGWLKFSEPNKLVNGKDVFEVMSSIQQLD